MYINHLPLGCTGFPKIVARGRR